MINRQMIQKAIWERENAPLSYRETMSQLFPRPQPTSTGSPILDYLNHHSHYQTGSNATMPKA